MAFPYHLKGLQNLFFMKTRTIFPMLKAEIKRYNNDL